MNQILAMSNQNKEQKKAIENDENKVNNPNNIDEQTNNVGVMPETAGSIANNNTVTPNATQDISNNVLEIQTNPVNTTTPPVQSNIESVLVQPQVNSAQNSYEINSTMVNTATQINLDLNEATSPAVLNNNITTPVQNIQNETNLNNATNNVQNNDNLNSTTYNTQNNVDLNSSTYNIQNNADLNTPTYNTQNNVDLNSSTYNTQNNVNLDNSAYNQQSNFNTTSQTNNVQNNIDLNNSGIGANMNINTPNPNEYNSNVNSAPNSYNNNQVENYNDYEGNRKQKKVRESNGSADSGLIKRAAIIFSIILIVFAVVIIAVKLIPMIGKSSGSSAPNAEINKPQIIISRLDENTISLSVKYTEEITKLRYWWNEDLEHIEEKNNKILSMEVTIPEGEVNTIHIEVQDKTGTITELSQDLVREKPKIQFIKNGDSIDIIATSDKGISSLVYYWNDEEANTVIPTEDSEYELSTTIEMRRGMNTLYAILTDSEGNTEQLDEMIKGVKKPEVKIQFSEDQLLAVIIISHDMGLEKIEFDVNGKETIFDSSKSGYDSEKTSYRFKVAIKPGIVNTVTVRAYSNEDLNDTEKTSEEVTKECDLTDVDTTEEE